MLFSQNCVRSSSLMHQLCEGQKDEDGSKTGPGSDQRGAGGGGAQASVRGVRRGGGGGVQLAARQGRHQGVVQPLADQGVQKHRGQSCDPFVKLKI